MLSQLLYDARFAVRAMLKRPGPSLLVVATLAVGLAANATIFSSLDALLLRPLAFPNLPRLVRLYETAPGAAAWNRSTVAPGNFHDWRAQSTDVLSELVALEWWDANLRGREVPERVSGFRVSPRFFHVLGVVPRAGRGFLDEEGREGANRQVVLGYDLWQRTFGGDAAVVGQSVVVDGEPHEVVGSAPRGFRFPMGAEMWSPLVLAPAGSATRDAHYLSAIGLLAEGRSIDDASSSLALVAQRLQKDHPDTNASRGVVVGPLQRSYEDIGLRPLFTLWQLAAGLVLLIACVNVANLMLARGAERQREIALRLALGAGRGQIVRQLLTEGLVTSALAIAVSLPLSAWAAREMRQHMPAEILRFLPGWDGIGLDGRSVAFSIALGLAATLIFTLVPALRASRSVLTDALKEGGRSSTVGAGRQRGRSLLVVTQVAGALALVVIAGLAVKSARTLLLGPQGYDPDHLLTLQVTLPEGPYKEPAARRAFARNAEERLAAIPGVTGVGLANAMPGRDNNSWRSIQVEGEPAIGRSDPPVVDDRAVSPGYFEALRLPLVAGRGLRASDEESALQVAVVSRSLAERYWPGRDPLGRRFRLGDEHAPWLTVVGVSGDHIHQWFTRRNYPTSYRPFAQDPRTDVTFALRTTGHPEALAPAARLAVSAVDPSQPAYNVWSQRRAISLSTIGLQYVAAIMAVFGGLALVLAITGVYGVMSYRVNLRTQEIGVRVALGASARDVLRLTLAQAVRLTAAGLVVGGAAGLAAARAISSALMGTIPFDAATFAVATAFLATTALLAAYVPARRALAIDPAQALRAD
jgi:putative ABC transport system permease protein